MTKRRWALTIGGLAIALVSLVWLAPSIGRQALAQGASTVQTHSASIGTVLADSNGKTLYTHDGDDGKGGSCTGACTTPWPPLLLASGNPVAPAGVPGTLAVVTRAAGGRQVTYNGQALFNFVRDANAGDTMGDGVNAFGGVWHAAKPAAAGVASAPPGTGTGGAIGHSSTSSSTLAGLALAGLALGLVAFVLLRRTVATKYRD